MTSFAPYKGIQDSLGFWIRRSGFRISGNGFRTFSLKFGFRISIVSGIPRIPWAVVRISKPRIQDSTSKNFLDSGIWTPLHGATSCLTANCMVKFTSSAKHKLLKTFPWQRFCWRKAYSLTIEVIRDKTLIQNNKLILTLSRLHSRPYYECVWWEGGRGGGRKGEGVVLSPARTKR